MAVADLRGARGTCAPPGPKFFQFHAVFGKIWQNHMLASPLGSWRPLLGEILDPPLHVISLKNNVPLSDFGDIQIFIIWIFQKFFCGWIFLVNVIVLLWCKLKIFWVLLQVSFLFLTTSIQLHSTAWKWKKLDRGRHVPSFHPTHRPPPMSMNRH